jgi:hypothetical protein
MMMKMMTVVVIEARKWMDFRKLLRKKAGPTTI